MIYASFYLLFDIAKFLQYNWKRDSLQVILFNCFRAVFQVRQALASKQQNSLWSTPLVLHTSLMDYTLSAARQSLDGLQATCILSSGLLCQFSAMSEKEKGNLSIQTERINRGLLQISSAQVVICFSISIVVISVVICKDFWSNGLLARIRKAKSDLVWFVSRKNYIVSADSTCVVQKGQGATRKFNERVSKTIFISDLTEQRKSCLTWIAYRSNPVKMVSLWQYGQRQQGSLKRGWEGNQNRVKLMWPFGNLYIEIQ